MIVGDFNARTPAWDLGRLNRRGLLSDWLRMMDFQLVNVGADVRAISAGNFIRGPHVSITCCFEENHLLARGIRIGILLGSQICDYGGGGLPDWTHNWESNP